MKAVGVDTSIRGGSSACPGTKMLLGVPRAVAFASREVRAAFDPEAPLFITRLDVSRQLERRVVPLSHTFPPSLVAWARGVVAEFFLSVVFIGRNIVGTGSFLI